MHKEEKGHLTIALFQKAAALYCTVTDDGIGREKAKELRSKSTIHHKSMGMRITADRIALLQPKDQQDTGIHIRDLTFTDGLPAGTEVLFKIPMQYD